MVEDLSYFQLGILLLFISPLIFYSYYFSLGVLKTAFWSILRMFIQLSLVGIYLHYIFALNNLYINFAYFIIMSLVSSLVIKGNLHLKKGFFLIFISSFIPSAFILSVFIFLIVKPTPLWDAKYIIPLGGMILGHTIKENIIALNHFFGVFSSKKREYLYSLGLGASKLEALMPYIKDSLNAIIIPSLSNMATLGLVSLPGTMTGQILAGSIPTTAVKYQIAVALMHFFVQMQSPLLSLLLISKFFFTDWLTPKENLFLKEKTNETKL